ncbi:MULTISPECIES: RDD family protein [unclassified Chryseobacterium]|uniref:RDD family protein n=1 Tax=unclassified Chryseobacterium TaxID=2593645 RepID=UPI000F44D82B|nr:RDD family protein [Chryseobacterium sp. G0240]ROI01592.1 RDD family protein [Chryseobacterium sp. G0240]
MRKYLTIVDKHKASSGIRFINYVLDRIFIQIIFYMTFFMLGMLYTIIYGEVIDGKAIDNDQVATFYIFIFYLVLSFLYFFFMEYYLGRTLAKYITGTEVVSIDGAKPGIQQIISRTFIRAVPFNSLSFLGQNGWHDSWSETRVINRKNYHTEKQAKSEIDDLGRKEIL